MLSGFENLVGSALHDILIGNGGVNVINGGDGNDQIEGGAGADVLDGGAGIDLLNFENSTAGVTVTLGPDGTQSTGKGGDAEDDKISNIENLTGSDHADTLTGDAGANTLSGGGDHDIIGGGAENDTLFGGSGDDTIKGNTGDDVVQGGDGADVLIGGLGTGDWLDYQNSSAGVTVTLGAADVETVGAGGEADGDKLKHFEHVLGSLFVDQITGNGGNNIIRGFAGKDVIDGAGGSDLVEGGAGDDQLTGGNGNDTLSYASAAAGVTVDLSIVAEQDTVGAGKDTVATFENLVGSAFNDKLFGDGQVNVMSGGEGFDRLHGSVGADVLDGGASFDTLDYTQSAAGVTVTLGDNGAKTVGAGGDAAGDQIANFEMIDG